MYDARRIANSPFVGSFIDHPLLSDDLLHPFQILGRDGFFQLPDDIHGLAASMADIGGLAQEGIGRGTQGILFEFTDEQQDFSILLSVMDISAACR